MNLLRICNQCQITAYQISLCFAIARETKACTNLDSAICFLISAKIKGDDPDLHLISTIFNLVQDNTTIINKEQEVLKTINYDVYSLETSFEYINNFMWDTDHQKQMAFELIKEKENIQEIASDIASTIIEELLWIPKNTTNKRLKL
jgi:hypothetical protein